MTEKEYNDCVTLYADGVYRFIVKNLRHEEDARDVVQTAFEKLWRNRDNVDATKSKSYLFTVAYNQMIDHLRKIKRMYLALMGWTLTIKNLESISERIFINYMSYAF